MFLDLQVLSVDDILNELLVTILEPGRGSIKTYQNIKHLGETSCSLDQL